MIEKNSKKKWRSKSRNIDPRLRFAFLFVALAVTVIGIRLVMLMIVQHDFYSALATGSQEISKQLIPERGEVYIQDSRSGETFPLAINRDYFVVFADTRKIETKERIREIATALGGVFGYDDQRLEEVVTILSKENDPYEPIEQKVNEGIIDQLKALDLPEIGYVRKSQRFYPEKELAAQVIGFLGKTEDGRPVGHYGVEGYWNEELSGSGGFFEGSRTATGRWIPLAGRLFEPAKDGLDLTLTIDRTLQYKACERLRAAMEEYQAESAALVLLDPNTGAIRAMCSLPDFNPNTYNEVESINVYNNTTIFTPYEPGSVFKPIAMSAAINEELVAPGTPFYDTGEVSDVCDKPIRNAGGKIYEQQTMTGILENSINTGMVYVAKLLGKKRFLSYVEDFGFGVKEGIQLDTEVGGTVNSLSKNKGNAFDCYTATAAFGQGLTVTPLQLAASFGAIANGGTLLKPYIVAEKRYPNGKVEKTNPTVVREVLRNRSASLVSGMLVNVIDSGQAAAAGVPGYYIAGKTGTAQIAEHGEYIEDTIHSFVGFGPVDHPVFTMVVKFEKPQRKYSASTAAPVFGDIASIVLDYYQVPPER